jgi:small nuclear ribonucleoprotein (snRNP)-like protein
MIETNAPREIHVDIREEYKKSKDKTNVPRNTASSSSSADTTDDASRGGDCDDSPFVKLKSYNTASNLNLHTTTNETKERTHKFASADNKIEKQETSSLIIRENANRYSYRGKLSDYEEHHNTFLAERRKADTAATAATTSSYADFKKRTLRSAL